MEVVKLEGLKFAVTGAGGFLGHRMVEELLRRGAAKVHALDIRTPSSKAREDVSELYHKRVEFHTGDIRSLSYVVEAIKGVDCVFHLASFGMSGREMLKPPMIFQVNVEGTNNILRACFLNKVPVLVYTSTANVLFDGFTEMKDVDETFPYPPLDQFMDHYSRTKCMAEQNVLIHNGSDAFRRDDLIRFAPYDGMSIPDEKLPEEPAVGADDQDFRLTTCSIRPTGIYGEGEERHLPRVVDMFKTGVCVFRIGPSTAKMDWVYIDNLVFAHLLAAQTLIKDRLDSKAAGKSYFIGDKDPINMFEFLRPMIDGLGFTFPPFSVQQPLMYRVAQLTERVHAICCKFYDFQPWLTCMEVQKLCCTHYFSMDNATRDLGYEPIVSFEEGMRRTVDALKERERRLSSFQRDHLPKVIIFTLLFLFFLFIIKEPRHLQVYRLCD
eukprot:TRINITY_DN3362_c0_g1_i1.p1 TRINITY_DN3362_c0_g1~~TRINITY_DN3362_c0_g1_i1.p1  ORF type:complete len:438 (+),score=146.36 TRINITY_DN3362_c0_g1_i1:108-1421(+)